MRLLDGVTHFTGVCANWVVEEEIVKDRETWCAVVHGISKSWTGLSN